MLDRLRQRILRRTASATDKADRGSVHSVGNTDASPSILSAWQTRLAEYDRKVSEDFGLPAADITSMSAADLFGQLLMIRLMRAAERQGHSLIAEGDHGLQMLAVLSACALQAAAAAGVTLMRVEPSVKIAPERLRDAVLTWAAVHGAAREADWRAAFSDIFMRASAEIQRATAATGGAEADFAKLVSSLGILEVQPFAAGSEQDRKLDRIADAIVRISVKQQA